MSSIGQIAMTQVLVHRKRASQRCDRQLWDQAAKALKEDNDSTMDLSVLNGRVPINDVQATVQNTLDQCVKKRWVYTRSNGEKVVLYKILERIVKWVNKFKEVGDITMQYDPAHAALPWAAVRFLLQGAVNSVETFGIMAEGVELTSRIITIYAEVEKTCLKGVSKLKTLLASRLITLYTAVLKYLVRAGHYFSQSTGKRVLKGALQTFQSSVSPWLNGIREAEADVSRLVELVQAEDQKNILFAMKNAIHKLQDSITSPKLPDDERRRQVHKWLEAISTIEKYQASQALRHGETCNWIFARREFQDWISPTNAIDKCKLLWIHGGPGFGKTILCARIIDYLTANSSHPVVHFFCVADEDARREPDAILRSWIDQLAQVSVDALDIVFDVYKANELRSPTPFDLWKLFKTLAQEVRCTFVVDGMDECTTINKHSRYRTTDARSKFLESLIQASKGTKARILIVSRDSEDIREQLGKLSVDTNPMLFEYGILVKDTQDDICLCSAHMVNTKLARKPAELKSQLASEAAHRSDGMFLWLHLLSRDLDPGENAKRLRRIVSEMPAGIDMAYERDLEKVANLKSYQKERAITILRWILFAARPLTVRELAEAVAISSAETESTYPEDELPTSWHEGFVDEEYVNAYIRRSCGSLVELRSNGIDESLALQTLHFVHFSVKEYLLRPDISAPGRSRFEAICFPDGVREHNRLAQLCLQYLCYDVFGGRDQDEITGKDQHYPFLSYAARYWYTHALHNHIISEDIMRYAQKLFNPATSNWRVWSKVFDRESESSEEDHNASLSSECSTCSEKEQDQDEDEDHDHDQDDDEEEKMAGNTDNDLGHTDRPLLPTQTTGGELEEVSNRVASVLRAEDSEKFDELWQLKDPSPIYYASMLGLTDIVKALLSQGFDCATPGGKFGFPLQVAVVYGQQQILEYLLGHGADVRQRGGLYGSAVGAAAALGFDTIMEILIKAGADLQCEDKNGRNPLHSACHAGSTTIAKKILDLRVDLMKASRFGNTPLFEAVESGHCDIVSLLLDYGADPNTRDGEGSTVLLAAVAHGFKEVTEVLIKHGADVEARNIDGITALQWAAYHDNAELATLLLTSSADIEAMDDDNWSALHYAVSSKGNTVAKILLEKGSKVEVSTNDGWSPLHIAAENGHEELLPLLLQKGADLEAENALSCSSLFSAVWTSKYECVKTLLAHGADIFKTSANGKMVLDEALEQEDKDMINLLLEHGALCHLASSSQSGDHLEISEERKALSSSVAKAFLNGDSSETLHLIEKSDKAHFQDLLDDAILLAALFNAIPLAETLFTKGASLAAITFNKRTPLHLAASRGFAAMVRSLMDHGADIRAKDIVGSQPLDLAVARGLRALDASKLLVENGALAKMTENTAPLDAGLKKKLQGSWSGTYTYASWEKDRIDPTSVTLTFVSDEPETNPR